MGGGAMWLPVTAAGGGDTYPRSTPFAPNFHPPHHQSLPAIQRAPYLPCSTRSTGLAEACDIDNNLDGTSSEIEGRKTIASRKSYFDLGPAPTPMEAEKAMADLQRFIESETKSDMSNSIGSMVSSMESRTLQSAGYGRGGRLPDALSALRNDPAIESMVISISCDKAVWDAILGNAAVQDLQGSLSAAREEKTQSSTEKLDIVDFILKYLTGITKLKVMELIEKLGALVAEIFKPSNKAKPASELNHLVEEKIRHSLHLTIVIVLIVIVTRNS